MYRAHHTAYSSIHAEHHAILNLQPLPKKHHLKKIDLVVIRTSKTGLLGMSKPCINCVFKMYTMPKEKGYRICNVIYSDNNGNFISTSLDKLLNDTEKYMSSFYRNNNFKLRCLAK